MTAPAGLPISLALARLRTRDDVYLDGVFAEPPRRSETLGQTHDPRLRHGMAAAGAAEQHVIAVAREGDGAVEVDDLGHG